MLVRPRHLVTAGLIVAATLTTSFVTAPGSAAHGGRPLSSVLTGPAEAPGPGDPDGRGTAALRTRHSHGQVCVDLEVRNIDPATAAHIHKAPPGSPGPVVVPLTPPTNGSSSGCYSATEALVRDIAKNPGDYYVNVHNAAFPAGAIRGQLEH